MKWFNKYWVKRFVLTLILSLGFLPCLQAEDNLEPADTNKVDRFVSLDMNTLDDVQLLQKGYTINYQVIEDRDEPTKLTITDSGELVVPYYTGIIKAAGKTCRGVAYDIKKALESTHYKRATVLVSISSIAYTNTGTISVMGNVARPGLQNLLPGETYTVTMAIAKAGGGTDFANLRKVRLTRIMETGETRTFVVNVKDVQEKGKLELDMDVKAGDYIFVPQSYFR